MKTLKVLNVLSAEEFSDSSYSKDLASNFGMEHNRKSANERFLQYNPTYFIIEKEHYGLKFCVWVKYKADGINFFAPVSYGSSGLTNGGLRQVEGIVTMVQNSEQFKALQNATKEVKEAFIGSLNEITFAEVWYDKGEANRKVFRTNGMLLSGE